MTWRSPVIGSAREVYLTLDWTDPKTKDGQFHTLRCNVRAHGRAMPIAWTTVEKRSAQAPDARVRTGLMRTRGPSAAVRVPWDLVSRPWLCHGPIFSRRRHPRLGWDYPEQRQHFGVLGRTRAPLNPVGEATPQCGMGNKRKGVPMRGGSWSTPTRHTPIPGF